MDKNLYKKTFRCSDFNFKTTYEKCLRNCNKQNKAECAKENLDIEIEVEEVRNLENQRCPKCGSYLVSHLYFAFCPQCGLNDDEDIEEE